MQSWLIGSAADCDVVVGSPLASGRHCRLTRGPAGLVIEDLSSTHGTFVDGKRITGATPITAGQEIMIGQTVPMPWPPGLVKFVKIGRVAGNDIVLDDLRVSSRHARLMIVGGSEALIEDLGSSNGTFLNSVDSRVTRLTPLSISDTVYFGSMAVPASRLLAGLLAAPPPPPAPVRAQAAPPQSPSPAPRKSPQAAQVEAPSSVNIIVRNRWLLAALGIVPLLAILIIFTSGRQAGAAPAEGNRSSIAQAIITTTFALSVAASWLGFSLAVAEVAGAPPITSQERADLQTALISLGSRLAILLPACALGCAVLLAIVYVGSGLKGPWLFMCCVMVIASAVCLLLGLFLKTLIKSWQTVALCLLGCLVLMTALGGWLWPLARSGAPVSWTMGAMPTRWAFEGLLLLESSQHPASESSGDPIALATPDHDLAEAYFPAESERMGPVADLNALFSMLIGLTFALALASTRPG